MSRWASSGWNWPTTYSSGSGYSSDQTLAVTKLDGRTVPLHIGRVTTVQRFFIFDGDWGVEQTLDHMANVIRAAIAMPLVRSCATALVGDCAPKDAAGQCLAIRAWMAAHIVFLRDPAGVELLHTPEWMLRRIHADGCIHVDCDDAAILGGALAGAIGLRVALVAVAFLDKSGGTSPYSHVWCSAADPTAQIGDSAEWIEFDVTRPMQVLPLTAIARSTIRDVC